MHIRLAESFQQRTDRDELASILRACVHCGFCNATCPTYLQTGNELEGPRGRIYLMKQVLEGQTVSQVTRQHLDSCLNCRSCETTCPSGVRYGRLLDTTSVIVEGAADNRRFSTQLLRRAITTVFPYSQRFSVLLDMARLFKPLLPKNLAAKIPTKPQRHTWPDLHHARKMLVLKGCVQNQLAPQIDYACATVFDKLGISLIAAPYSGCCGALSYHLSQHQQALTLAKQNIDACWPLIEQGAEAILITSSGCGVMVKDYGYLLRDDFAYADKAARFAALVKDPAEVLVNEDLSILANADNHCRIAFQSPCTLQHGQKLSGLVESLLRKVGYQLVNVTDEHLCCGSAGAYSLLNPKMANRLREQKWQALTVNQPSLVATANIGCLSHLQSASGQKIVHWLELLAALTHPVAE